MLIPDETMPTIISMNCLENPVLCHKQNGTTMLGSGICSKIFGLYPTVSCPLVHLYIRPTSNMVPAIPWILRGFRRSFDPSLYPCGCRGWASSQVGHNNLLTSWLWNCSSGDHIITGGIRKRWGSNRAFLSNGTWCNVHGETWSKLLQIAAIHFDQQSGMLAAFVWGSQTIKQMTR